MSPAKNGNIKKYNSYKLAWERIKAAIEYQFPVEAIAFEESIISDRLRAYADHIEYPLNKYQRNRIAELIKVLEKALKARNLSTVNEYKGLPDEIRDWCNERNKFIHAIVKTDCAGVAPKPSAEEFLEEAMKTAKKGARLARKLQTLIRRAEVSQEVEEP